MFLRFETKRLKDDGLKIYAKFLHFLAPPAKKWSEMGEMSESVVEVLDPYTFGGGCCKGWESRAEEF